MYLSACVAGYLISLLLCIVFFIGYLEPRYAHERILVWLLLCSSISSCTVAACRGFASLVTLIPTECFAGEATCHHGVLHPPCEQTIGHGLFWTLLATIIVTAVWSAMYLNKAMMVYGNTEVVPVYYCTFTLMCAALAPLARTLARTAFVNAPTSARRRRELTSSSRDEPPRSVRARRSILGGMLIYNELGDIDVAGGILFGFGVLLAFSGVGVLMSGREPEAAKVPKTELAGASVAEEGDASPSRIRPSIQTGEAPEAAPKAAVVQAVDATGSGQRSAWTLMSVPSGSSVASVEVTLSFRDLGLEDKVVEMEQQPSSSNMVYGIGSSLVQASTDALIASGGEGARLHVETANYPSSLSSACRMKRVGRLAVGSVTSAVFGDRDNIQRTSLITSRTQVNPVEGGADIVEPIGGTEMSAALANGQYGSAPSPSP